MGERIRTKNLPEIEVRNVSFSYKMNHKEKKQILSDISFFIDQGKITTIMGANGSGKSTLFALMTKNQEPDEGKIFLRGKNIRNIQLKEFATKIAVVNQVNRAADDITVAQIVSYGRNPHKKVMEGYHLKDREKIDWGLEMTGLKEFRDRELGKLSGGQRQRVWIAMSLVQETKILFLDEPTTYLDIRYQIEILELVRRLNEELGMTIVMVLHDINQSIHFSHKILGLSDGRICVQGDPKEVLNGENLKKLYGIELEVTSSGFVYPYRA